MVSRKLGYMQCSRSSAYHIIFIPSFFQSSFQKNTDWPFSNHCCSTESCVRIHKRPAMYYSIQYVVKSMVRMHVRLSIQIYCTYNWLKFNVGKCLIPKRLVRSVCEIGSETTRPSLQFCTFLLFGQIKKVNLPSDHMNFSQTFFFGLAVFCFHCFSVIYKVASMSFYKFREIPIISILLAF